jgi:exosortase/archaeosortase family protein
MTTASLRDIWVRPRAALALGLMARPASGVRVVPCRPAYLSPLGWLALQAAALWPHGLWMVRRVQDESDDPLGLAAMAVLVLLLWRLARQLRVAPQPGWLATSAALTVLATLGLFGAPLLVAALMAALALAAGLMAWMPRQSPRLPFAGLALLALPLVSSLQYYGGYPLRLLTAQLSAWALQLVGVAAERSGASMVVNGQLVIVDAPCSGVQMLWMAYFCACAVAAFGALRDATFALRLPFVGLTVLIGNVLRNTVLVALESRPQGLSSGWHEAIGLFFLAAVCASVLTLMKGERRDALV